MSKYFKLFLAIFGAIVLANIATSGMFTYFSNSATERAIEQSQKHIESIQNNQQAYLQATVDRQEIGFNHNYSTAKSFNSLNAKAQQKAYQKQQDQNYQISLRNKKNKDLTRLRIIERDKKREEAKEKSRLKNEKYKLKEANKRADREHIKKENMKTCKFWTQQFEDNPTAKNNALKQTSCDRAYGY